MNRNYMFINNEKERKNLYKIKCNSKNKSKNKFVKTICILSICITLFFICYVCMQFINIKDVILDINKVLENELQNNSKNKINNLISKDDTEMKREFNEISNKKVEVNKIIESSIKEKNKDINMNINNFKESMKEEIEKSDIRVVPHMNFIFRTLYKKDDNQIETIKHPTSFDVDMNMKELSEKYKEWNIIKMSHEEIVFYKEVEDTAPNYYVIGEKDGYLAIFHEDEELGLRLREVTERKVESFELNEQKRIKNGIKVYGDENLIKILEDYIS